MPTHFQRSENDIYPHNPPTSPQTLAWCLWHHRSLRKSLSPAPPPPMADRGSDSVRGQGVHMLECKTVGKASALGKRTSRSEAVRLVPLRLSTSGSVSYNAAYTHPAPVRLPLSSSQSTCEEVTSSYHNMPGSYQDNGYEDSQISALLPIYYQ